MRTHFTIRIAALSAFAALVVAFFVPAAAAAYSEGTYYSQSSYYTQSYYQGSYTGACGTTRTVMAPADSNIAWAGGFLRAALMQLFGSEVDAYSQGAYYSQSSYYFQSYYQGAYGPTGVCITKYPYSSGTGGYAPSSNTYWGGGGGGGLVINNSTVSAGSGYGSSGNGGAGYGAGGGGSNSSAYGGSGAPGVVYVEWDDAAPSAPSVSGPTSLSYGVSGTFTFTSTDPEADPVRYGIDWDGNGSVDEWNPSTATSASGAGISVSHTWSTTYGVKTFKVMAEDDALVDSGWTTYTVTITQAPPVALLTASPSSVSTGQSSTLTWSSSNATSCTGTNFSTGGATSGTLSVTPTQTTTYTVTCTGPGGSDSSSKTVAYSCTPQNICTDGNVVNSCTGATIQLCSYSCSAGACTVPPPTSFTGFTDSDGGSQSGHLAVKPSLIRAGGTTQVYWNISNISTCTVSGTNGDSWSGSAAGCSGGTCFSGASGKASRGMLTQTTFTLSCTGLDSSSVQESQTVNVVPVFQEQ